VTLNELKCKEDLDFSILSERLLLKRTDRPDEWSMDELASMALKIETRVKELEADLAKSHDDGYAMGWREALEIAQEKIMGIER
jgi:hypothetical protein